MLSAVILAGGKGERLYPLTNTRPKPLCPVSNISPLVRAIKKAQEAGADEIIVTAHYMAEQIKKEIAGFPQAELVTEEKPLGTAGAVVNARPGGDTIIVISGDIYFDFGLKYAIEAHQKSGCDVTIVTTNADCPTEYGIISSCESNIRAVIEKPSWSRVTTNTVNTGIYILKKQVLDSVPEKSCFDFTKDLFPNLIKNGKSIKCFHNNGYWSDIGTPYEYYKCNMRFSGGKSVISKGAVVSQTASVTESIIMNGSVIGKNTILDRCIICENVKIGENCFIPEGCIIGANTIISDDVVIGKNIVVTNNVFIGRRARIMKNIYFGEVKKRLFDSDSGISGVYGANFDSADAVYLGQSLSQLKNNSEEVRFGVMYRNNQASKLLAEGIMCGIRFGGGVCLDLEDGFPALCGFCCIEYNLNYAVFVEVSDEFNIKISVFDSSGMYLSREGERKLENAYYRRKAIYELPKEIVRPESNENAKYKYAVMLLSQSEDLTSVSVKINDTKEAGSFLYAVINKLGADVSSTSGEVDLYSVSHDGHTLEGVSGDGRPLSWWHFICIYYSHLNRNTEKSNRTTAYIDELAPQAVSQFLSSQGLEIVYYNDSENPERTRASAHRELFDGNLLALKVMNIQKETQTSLSDLLNEIPSFFIQSAELEYDEEQKAATARRLSETSDNHDRGIRFNFEELGSVTIIPSSGAAFKIFAESVSAEVADELCRIAKEKILNK
ncbi:NTP transferase domain-containing protein [Eubacteriales bacterium OttesenSCG-928-G02]|nr:NTP transferase domain-containing protein [Eubacteriales bacterium OttesenSCG-928-G02]